MRRFALTTLIFATATALAQLPLHWEPLKLPPPDCKMTPWLDACPDHDKWMKSMETPPWLRNTGNVGSGTANRPPAPVPAPRTPVPEVDWRRPLAAQPLAADWPRWRFAPADASLVLGMKLPALLRSPLVRQILTGLHPDQLQAPAEEIWISIDNPSRPAESVLLLVGPALDPVAAALRAKGSTVCFLDAHSVLVGEWNAVNRAVQRVLVEKAPAGPADRRTREMWANSDVWFMAGRKWTSTILASSPSTSIPESISRIEIGVTLQDNLAFDLFLHTAKAVEAEQLAERYKKNPAELDLPEGASGLEIRKFPDGVSVRAALDAKSIPESLRREMAEQFKPALELGRTAAPRPAGGPIVIEGLNEGPRVISPK